MAEPPLFKGVPIMFFACDLLGTLLAAVCLLEIAHVVYAVLVVGVGVMVYLVVLVGRKIEPRFTRIAWEYWSYRRRYEG
jgi:hypothetical protein